MDHRFIRMLSLALLSACMFTTGCGKSGDGNLKAEVDRLTVELETTKAKAAAAEKAAQSVKDGQVVVSTAAEQTKTALAAKEQALVEKDNQIRTLQTELTDLRKRDALVYAEISAVQQKGLTTIAVGRYQQFIVDYPASPLAADAKRAVAELSAIAEKETKWKTDLIDPKRDERQAMQHFNDGIATVEELAPLLKRRTSSEVVKLLGQPNKSYRNNTEIGYVDKVIDSTTGGKGTLVITFEGGRVGSLRVGYGGRPVKP